MNTDSHLRCLRVCSAGLAAAGTLLASACQQGTSYESRPYLDSRWVKSSYELPLRENLRLKKAALAASGKGHREVCGAILKGSDGNDTLSLFFVENASNRSHSYEFSPRSIQRIRQAADDCESAIIGAFHSHPSSDAAPGPGDLIHARVGSLLLIHSVPSGQTRLWRVIRREGVKKAREIQLQVIGHRPRGPSPLTPSPRKTSPVAGNQEKTYNQ